MKQQEAIQLITERLKQDEAVQAIFLKGSFGRGEADEHSDIDLYVMVHPDEEASFLSRRLEHLNAYRPILLKDEIHIVAPQLIVVFDDFLHLDLFTVTQDTLNHQDSIHVIYDPQQRLARHATSLQLDEVAISDHAFDTVWFFFQYTKLRNRGNDIWAAEMLRQGMVHFAYVLAAHHTPDRASLGLKDVTQRQEIDLHPFYNQLTPANHEKAARLYIERLKEEQSFFQSLSGYNVFGSFMEQLLQRETNRP
ncbi:nucleotidyltransferase domain-containing protein [Exiguobacterium sp. B2(2022)]|uniref:nucleotidyltransferase domain-containing protein n=1 Tax=Exiguobacterium sp. B2(2022) TaxID=2992755 RepID=UPI00237B61A9|nr:nucleotidyltransferase domain-containing protein [Exiguobacterium sp. B2(2022)]MDE0562890.1 nucleotidyltransferase domain-containing protein [Exiguobacterium sp. B2(2022)]